MDLISTFDQVAPAVEQRLAWIARDLEEALIVEPTRPLFNAESGRDILCHSWKLVSRSAVTFTLDLIGSAGQGDLLVRVNGRPVLRLDRNGEHAAELVCAQVGLALDVAFLEAA